VDNRNVARYGVALLLENLTKVLLVFPDKHEIESCIVDISSQGLRVSVPPSDVSFSLPQKNETVIVVFQSIQLQLACRYIYSMYNRDCSMLLGFYVFDPDEQSKLRELLDRIE
jgi:hypothetical protein